MAIRSKQKRAEVKIVPGTDFNTVKRKRRLELLREGYRETEEESLKITKEFEQIETLKLLSSKKVMTDIQAACKELTQGKVHDLKNIRLRKR